MFLKGRRDSIAVALPALLVGIGGAVETSRAVTFRQRLWSAVELSCAQGAAYVNAQKPLDVKKGDTTKTYPTMIQTLAVRNFAAKNLANITPVTTPASDVLVHVEATGSQNLVFSNLLSKANPSFSASKDCAVISTADALKTVGEAPELLFSESFERNHSVASNSWTVLGGKKNSNTWNGWTTQAAGIEINGIPELADNTLRFGNFFADLDSNCGTAANTNNSSYKSNSTMSRIMNLTPDDYEVRYWYIARLRDASRPGQVICGTKDSDVSWYTTEGQTNRIEMYVEKSGSYNFTLIRYPTMNLSIVQVNEVSSAIRVCTGTATYLESDVQTRALAVLSDKDLAIVVVMSMTYTPLFSAISQIFTGSTTSTLRGYTIAVQASNTVIC